VPARVSVGVLARVSAYVASRGASRMPPWGPASVPTRVFARGLVRVPPRVTLGFVLGFC
jgi:hypothetical protein